MNTYMACIALLTMVYKNRVRLLTGFLAAVCIASTQEAQATSRAVTYGSGIALVHEASGHKLYSGKIAWGSGSVGQAVTAQPAAEGSPSMWLVRPAGPPPAAAFDPQQPQDAAAPPNTGAGVPVKCGSTILLEHVGSQALLRTGQSEAPLSPHHEVGASAGGEGPEFRFVVECGEGDVWRTGAPVKLRNVMLGSTLQASKQHAFSYSNCGRGCPIAGHLEVSVARGRPSTWSWQQPADAWSAQPQLLFYAEGETDDSDLHDEL